MQLLQITDGQYADLETATIVSPIDEGGAIRFYIPAVDMPDFFTPLIGIRIETAMAVENDMVLWVQPDHPAFERIHDWISANSF